MASERQASGIGMLQGKQSALVLRGQGLGSNPSSISWVASESLGVSVHKKTEFPLQQAQEDFIYQELVRPMFQHGNETMHWWSFGAVAELLDNAVDEIPHGATKVLIDSIPNPRDGSPSLLIQDDGGGMDPGSLWNCITVASPKRKPPNSIGQNGKGFKAAVDCLGSSVIIFSRCVNTRMPTQSIGLLSHVSGDSKCPKHFIGPMVHYKYDPMTGGIMRYECKPGQFSMNMSMLLRWSPYNSKEELLKNFNDVGPHGTKIIVFNLSCNLELDFDTDKKDIRISGAQMPTINNGAEDQNNLVYQYRRSLRAYVSILYLGLPKNFRIILRREEVKRRNLATELKQSQCITYKRSATEREDKVVMGFLDGTPDDGMDRFSFYHKHRLISPFLPLCASHRNRSIVGILEANHLKPAKNKQDFEWSTDIATLQKILTEKRAEYWKHLKGKQLKHAACQLSLAPPVSHDEAADLARSNTTGMRSEMTPSVPARRAAPTFEPDYRVARAPPFPIAANGDRQQTVIAMANAWGNGASSNPILAPPPTPPFWSNGGGTSSHGIQRAPAPHRPAFAMASMAGDRHRPTMPTVTSTSAYGFNFNASSVSTAPRAYRAPPFSQPNCSGTPPNGVMRAPAPHLAASSTTTPFGDRRHPMPARSMALAAPPLHAMQATAAAANTTGRRAPGTGAMAAPRDLPIKMERDGMLTCVDTTALSLPGGAMPAASSGTAAPSTSAAAAPAPFATLALPADKAELAEPPAVHGLASSSRQGQELQGGSNQREKGAYLQRNQGRPVVSVKIERE